MILTRRRFLQAAAGTLFVAPAIVKAESLMKIWVPPPVYTIEWNSSGIFVASDQPEVTGEPVWSASSNKVVLTEFTAMYDSERGVIISDWHPYDP